MLVAGQSAESDAALVDLASDTLTLQSGHVSTASVWTVTRPPEERVQLTTRHRAAAQIHSGPLVYFHFDDYY